jgi:uncharacterized protein YjbJ (UPF0337 family)
VGEVINRTKGKIKQAVGDLTGNKKLKREGEKDEFKGQVKGVVKDVKRGVKDAVKSQGPRAGRIGKCTDIR